MNNAKFGLSNIQFSEDGENWKPLVIGTMEMVSNENVIDDEWVKDISKPFSITIEKRPKRYGDIFEKTLYYKNHKKKRIRKKYNLIRLLGGKHGSKKR